MSYFEDASLVYIPSAVKDAKTYSIKPTDGSGDLTFSRGSDIEATRVASNGYIEKAKVNLLLQSNTFSTTWANTRSTETSGQSGYDGSSDAWLIESTATAASARVYQSITKAFVHTMSVYAKAGNSDWMALLTNGNQQAYFDLANGVVGSTSGSDVIDSKIESVGGGWYRCSATFNGNDAFSIFIANGDGDTITNTGDSIYIQDAQLNYGLVAQEYQETTTTSVVAGITNDLPRLDYSGGASCPSLLLEPSRQNLVPHSDYIGSLVPEKGTITSNADTSPEGVLNATSFVEDSTTGRHRTSFFVSVTSGQTYTFSMFAKIKSGTRLLCINNASTIGARAYFNLVSGAVEGVDSGTASIEDYGDGWFRCSVTAQSSITGTATTYFGLEDGTADNGYTGDGTSGHYWYGLQLELGSYSSSLIPTYGTSNSRLKDSCSKTGISSLIAQTEGTLFLDITTTDDITTVTPIGISDGTATNRVLLYVGSGILNALVTVSGSAQATISSSAISANTRYKMAIAYKANDFAFYVNGALVGTDTNGTVPACSKFNYDNGSGSATFYGLNNQALLFKTRLTNAQLAELTTL